MYVSMDDRAATSRRRSWAIRRLALLALGGVAFAGAAPASAGERVEIAPAPAMDGAAPVPVPAPLPAPVRPLPPLLPIIPLAQVEPGDTGAASIVGDLEETIASVQQVLDAVAEWVRSAQDTAGNVLAEIVGAAPEDLPQGVDLSALVGSLAGLPSDLQRMLTALLAGWRRPVPRGTVAADYQTYVSASPELAHDAVGIAAAAATVATAAGRQQAATAAASQDAGAAAADASLPAAALAAHQVGEALLQGAPQLPSSRAGIEMLVAGMGEGMQQRAELDTALADRLTVLAQQLAAVSQQLGALGETTAALTARDAERDRRALDARLSLMEAARAGGQALSDMLAGAGAVSGTELSFGSLY